MDLELKGKTVIVSGASRGIGAAIGREFAREGAAVALAARNAAQLADVAGEIRQAGGRALPIALDLREPGAGDTVVKAAVAEFGRVDIVVGNAGTTQHGDFLTLSEEQWQDGFALKFFAHVRLFR